MREIAGGFGGKRLVHHRFRQPLPDIDLAPRLRRLHPVEAEPRDHGAEKPARVFDGGAVRRVPAQPGILHHGLGLGARAEHAVGEARQRTPMGLERGDRVVLCGLGHAALASVRSTGRISPPIVRHLQARP